MQALGYFKSHELPSFSITPLEVPEPHLTPYDLLIEVKAIAVNPIDYKIRMSRSSTAEKPVILGWDASGIVREVGSQVSKFKVGDSVFYAGDLRRDGCYAQLQAVDSRIVGKKPELLSFAEAASLPLTALTAWEALFERYFRYTPQTRVLVIGGAGGVGSMAIQLLRARTESQIIATASREETRHWCLELGAHHVIDHSRDLFQELQKIGMNSVDLVFLTTHAQQHLAKIPELLRPFGHFCLIDDPPTIDLSPFKAKSLTLHWELMFSKTLNNFELETQGEILNKVGDLIASRQIKPTAKRIWQGLTPENIRRAHELLESGRSDGKTVIEL